MRVRSNCLLVESGTNIRGCSFVPTILKMILHLHWMVLRSSLTISPIDCTYRPKKIKSWCKPRVRVVDGIAGPVHWCAIRQVADVVHEDGTRQRRASSKMPILNLMPRDWRYKRGWRQNLPSVTTRTIDTMNKVYNFEPRILLVLILVGSGPSRTGATNCHTRLCHSSAFRSYSEPGE